MATTSSPPSPTDVAKSVFEWDPNPGTKAELGALLEAGDADKIAALFGSRLQFGTAGLRGPMGVGTNRMNDVTVLQAAQGLCAYLEEQFGDDGKARGVVIGYDHREFGSLNSQRFAVLSAAAFFSRGFVVHMYQDIVATPLVPWALESTNAVAGIMVTASHNPKADNGYKVYYANGCQIISPHDKGIAAAILANLQPWAGANYAAATVESVTGNKDLYRDPTPLIDTYLAKVSSSLCRHKADNGSNAPVCYTAMHGVGAGFVAKSFEAFGLPAYIPTPEQLSPDPTFPTVAFPNPEEGKGALALAFKAAEAAGASVVLANDPDADRLAVAERGADGTWRVFTGNEIAALLAHWEWTTWRAANPTADPATVTMIASTVSSKMLGSMARKHGFEFIECLTGFKWIGNVTADRRAAGQTVLFGYEEAIGFCVGDVVKDKDGVCAASVFAEMTGALARAGKTLAGQFTELCETYGYFLTNNHYLIVDDPKKNDVIFARIRNEGHYWLKIGRFAITAVRDLTSPGLDTESADMAPKLPTSSSHMITFKFANGTVGTLRTSGTEPKLKFYFEMPGADPAATRLELDELVDTMIEEMLEPAKHGLTRPVVE